MLEKIQKTIDENKTSIKVFGEMIAVGGALTGIGYLIGRRATFRTIDRWFDAHTFTSYITEEQLAALVEAVKGMI